MMYVLLLRHVRGPWLSKSFTANDIFAILLRNHISVTSNVLTILLETDHCYRHYIYACCVFWILWSTTAVLHESNHEFELSSTSVVCIEDKTLLGPVVLLGPPDAVLNKPVVVSFRHCADVRQGRWTISVYAAFTHSDDFLPQWQVCFTTSTYTSLCYSSDL